MGLKLRNAPRWISLLILLGLGSCGSAPQPDVFLITIDTLRADRLGCYGYASAETPAMDKLAGGGVRYENCASPVPVTLPAHASIFTGQLPPRHGVRNNLSYRLPESVPTLAESFAADGYDTAAFVAAFPVLRRFGLDQGFDHYDDELPALADDPYHFRERAATHVVDAAVNWLRGRANERPVFVWLHFFEPHAPYAPTAPFDAMPNPYDGEIALADASVARFLEGLSQLRRRPRLIALTSDHGEGAGDHGEQSHAFYLYESTLHVPLILNYPELLPAGEVVEEAVGLIDLAPTLLSLAGLDPMGLDADGIVLEVKVDPPQRDLYAETVYGLEAYGWSPMFALRDGNRKVIRSAISRAFDLGSDPDELVDLLPQGSPWSQELLARLDSLVLSQTQSGADALRSPNQKEAEALAALGYVGSSRPTRGEGETLLQLTRSNPDATEGLQEFQELTRAQMHLVDGEFEQAIQLLRLLLGENPGNKYAWGFLGDAYRGADMPDSAMMAYQRRLASDPNNMPALLNLARLEWRRQNVPSALDYYERAVAADPYDWGNFIELMERLSRMGRQGEVVERVRVRLRSPNVDEAQAGALHGILARLYFANGRAVDGAEHLARARQIDDSASLAVIQSLYWRDENRWSDIVDLLGRFPELRSDPEAQLLSAIANEKLGRFDEALAKYDAALTLNDSMDMAHARTAWILATQLGRFRDAWAHAKRALELNSDQPENHEVYLEILERLERRDEARRHLAQVRDRFPGHPGLELRARRLGVP